MRTHTTAASSPEPVRHGTRPPAAQAIRAVLAALTAVAVLLPQGSAAFDREAPPRVTAVRPLPSLTGDFAEYAAHGGHGGPASHWTGGDSTYSARTPAGELWIFSDTFLGTVRPDGSRAPVTGGGTGDTTPFVHNSFVLWSAARGHGPRTVTGRSPSGRPTAVVTDDRDWYWARAALPRPADGGTDVVYARYARTGPGPLDVVRRGNALARFRRGDFTRPESLTPLPSATRTAWGAWLERGPGGTYVYGTEPAPSGGGHYLRLARVTGIDLRAAWQYRTADGSWSPDESRAARLTGADGRALRTADEVSVVRHGGWYALVTQRADEPFSAELQLAWSRAPGGPFTRPVGVYRAPEAGPTGSYRDRNVFAYNAHEHPELARPGELVVSYNVNSLAPDDVIRDASIYRPRFVRIALAPPAHR
ncbi:hypothetical protein ACFP1Z_10975 [Streptomyces gamaensis]|uniref:DUF4185 domain-containing protein n=1 Tax=Streptomyces gamaensis TaxID=1763542 RepID=A0ABW0Z218_9ACTN